MMLDDLDNDAEWLALLAGFKVNFLEGRVPAFLSAWQACHGLPASAWGDDLKRCLHGLAGTAAMVGHADVGDQARAIETLWDKHGAGDLRVHSGLDALAEALRQIATAD